MVPRLAYSLLPALTAVWIVCACVPVSAWAQVETGSDSVLVADSAGRAGDDAPEQAGRRERRHSPRGALWRALAVPGWGQLYNRQVVKLPFVYAAIGGVTTLAIANYTSHRGARRAFLYAAGLAEDPNPYEAFASYYTGTRYESLSAQQLFDFKNGLRRNRDLSFLGVFVVYGLTVLDAFVAAQLYDFDVSEDLSIGPWGEPGRWGMSVRVRW